MKLNKREENRLTTDNIFKKIDAYDIYKYFTNEDFTIGKAFCSPLRRDNNPSFYIYIAEDDRVKHLDFAFNEHSGDCIDFVQQKLHVDFTAALKEINRAFCLGLEEGTQEGDYKKITAAYHKPIMDKKKYSLIQVKTKKFTASELAYWNIYFQSIDDLRREEIYSPKEVWLNKRKVFIGKDELCFAYYYNGAWKIYFPYREKGNKWLSNVALSHAMHIEDLNPEKNSLICKSKKDYMVCRKIYDNVCYVQNEGLGAVTPEVAKKVIDKSKTVFYGGDSDEPGKKVSYKICETYTFKHINPVDRLLPDVKDFSQWAVVEGLNTVENHFKTKGLII